MRVLLDGSGILTVAPDAQKGQDRSPEVPHRHSQRGHAAYRKLRVHAAASGIQICDDQRCHSRHHPSSKESGSLTKPAAKPRSIEHMFAPPADAARSAGIKTGQDLLGRRPIRVQAPGPSATYRRWRSLSGGPLVACSGDEEQPAPARPATPQTEADETVAFKLGEQNRSGSSGSAALKGGDRGFTVRVALKRSKNSGPAHIHNVTCEKYRATKDFDAQLATVAEPCGGRKDKTEIGKPLPQYVPAVTPSMSTPGGAGFQSSRLETSRAADLRV
jgi:hypothetical protein